MMPFEKLDNSVAKSGVFSHADEIIAKGWVRRGYKAIDLRGSIPWRLEGQEQRSFSRSGSQVSRSGTAHCA
jgi:hypothetical protein